LQQWEVERARFWQVCPREMLTRLAHPLSDTTAVAAE
jgi:glutamate synthase (NADPH/NADH) large chain